MALSPKASSCCDLRHQYKAITLSSFGTGEEVFHHACYMVQSKYFIYNLY
ncbi:MAG: hypothetical protein MR279_01565 [Bacteroidales bacterium]|nr:hypothetical protein [Bacteroidales bacterium]MCI6416662.1 hypothetical protein [Bacteroidales bacterium]